MNEGDQSPEALTGAPSSAAASGSTTSSRWPPTLGREPSTGQPSGQTLTGYPPLRVRTVGSQTVYEEPTNAYKLRNWRENGGTPGVASGSQVQVT
ncbi:hypothetical protein QFC21_002770 [Naganishia friedmannii]|uniref:Uncharacterized protein n=1 Tax=Naganishia friedmannii TaxID=89922 RepID=A0ACC2VSH3_9TREE|nr:hypothetical protein QFC21_002770 [Naganishia friedmannii]